MLPRGVMPILRHVVFEENLPLGRFIVANRSIPAAKPDQERASRARVVFGALAATGKPVASPWGLKARPKMPIEAAEFTLRLLTRQAFPQD